MHLPAILLRGSRLAALAGFACVLCAGVLMPASAANAQLGALEAKRQLAEEENSAPPVKLVVADVSNLAEDETFEDEIVVIEVEIPVQVIAGGKPVRGLQKGNFELWDRGQRREILAFEAIDLRVPKAPAGRANKRNRAVVVSETVAEPAPPEESVAPERHFLALFDLVNARGNWISRAVKSVRKMLAEQLHPADRMAVATMGQNGAVLLLGFTEEREKLSVALDMVEATVDRDVKAYRQARESMSREQRQTLDELAASMGAPAALALGGSLALLDMPTPDALGADLNQVGFMEADSQIAVEAVEAFQIGATLETGRQLSDQRARFRSLERLITLLRGVPGQRYLLNFSAERGDFQQAISGGTLSRDSKSTLVGPGLLDSFHDLVSEFRRSGWVIHSFNLAGVPAAGGVTADGPTFGGPPPTLTNGGALFYLSNETGGRLYENFNRIEVATERLLEQTSVTYRLIFQAPELRRDGRYHDVDVKLVSTDQVAIPKKARVLARKGFYSPKPNKTLSDIERLMKETEELFYGPPEHALDGTLTTMVVPAGDEQRRVVLIGSVDLNPLLDELQDGPTRARMQVEVQALALCHPLAATGNETVSDQGVETFGRQNVADMFRETMELPWRDESSRLREGFRFVGDLIVPGDDHSCEARLRIRPKTRRGRARPGLLEGASLPARSGEHLAVGYFVAGSSRNATPHRSRPYLARERDGTVVQDPNSPLVVTANQVFLPLISPTVEPTPDAPSQLGVVFRVYGDAPTPGEPEFRVIDSSSGLESRAALRLQSAKPTADGAVFLGVLEIADRSSGDYQLVIQWRSSAPESQPVTVELPFSVAASQVAGG